MLITVKTDLALSEPVNTLLDASYREGFFQSREGQGHRWILDCRQALSNSKILKPIVSLLSAELESLGANQIVGYGVGASFLIGGLVMHGHENFRGSILRSERKSYGTGHELEGSVCRYKKLVIIDDILNSGQTSMYILSRLQQLGFKDISFISIFYFEWGRGEIKLKSNKVPVRCLARISMTQKNKPEEIQHVLKKNRLHNLFSRWLENW